MANVVWKIKPRVRRVLEEVIDQILHHPLQVNMGAWFSRGPSKDLCDSTACIAGWTVAVAGPNKRIPLANAMNARSLFTINGKSGIQEKAGEILGLSVKMERSLFFAKHWPKPFADRYSAIEGMNTGLTIEDRRRLQAFCVADRITHYIKTGK